MQVLRTDGEDGADGGDDRADPLQAGPGAGQVGHRGPHTPRLDTMKRAKMQKVKQSTDLGEGWLNRFE